MDSIFQTLHHFFFTAIFPAQEAADKAVLQSQVFETIMAYALLQ